MMLPFDENGYMLRAAPDWDQFQKRPMPGINYRGFDYLIATLQFKHFVVTSDSKYCVWEDAQRHILFPMSLKFLAEVIEFGIARNGIVSARWEFAKQGNAYSIKLG